MNKTDPEKELNKGRVALWLDPSDIAFRGMTALHKKGIQYDPEFPEEDRMYKLDEN